MYIKGDSFYYSELLCNPGEEVGLHLGIRFHNAYMAHQTTQLPAFSEVFFLPDEVGWWGFRDEKIYIACW